MQDINITSQGGAPTLRPLSVLEIEIKAHSVNATSSIVAIGRALLEAKAQLEHGQWAAWLTDKVQFSQSTAGNFMRIAREVNVTPALSNLPYTKVLPLLALPPEKRDEIISDPKIDDMSAAQLKAAIKAREEAERKANAALKNWEDAAAKANGLEDKLKAAQADYEKAKAHGDRTDGMIEKYSEAVADLQRQLKEAHEHANAVPSVVEVPPADYDGMKARIHEAEQYAEEAERRAKEAQQEAQRLRVQQDDGTIQNDDLTRFTSACGDFIGAVGMYQYMDARAMRDLENGEFAKLKAWTDTVFNWALSMQNAISSAETTIVDGDTM